MRSPISLTLPEIRRHLAHECELQTAESLARIIGVSPEFISMVIHGRRKPSKKILDYLGIQRVVSVRYSLV